MEIIKREISIRDTKNEMISFKINLTQKIDDLGMATDIPFESYDILRDNGDVMLFGHDNPNIELPKHYKSAGQINTITDSKSHRVKSYSEIIPYKEGLNISEEPYRNYKNEDIDGVDRVVKIDGEEITYVTGANADINLGTTGQTSGFLYVDNPNEGLNSNNVEITEDMITSSQYIGEGWNGTNTSIDPQIQKEYLIGIIGQPEVKSDVFIDRGVVSVLDMHLRLSEIESLDHLDRYGNGFYNINRD